MNYFSMPADFKQATLDGYDLLNHTHDHAKVVATYGNISQRNAFGSGRDIRRIPEMDLERLHAYVKSSKEKGIDFYYTLNASYVGNREFTSQGKRDLQNHLKELQRIGIAHLVIAMPSLIEIVRLLGWDSHIKASVISQITSPNKALYFKKMGADSIMIDETINRDFVLLEGIRKAFGERVEIIVNSVCHQDCQYRMFHYNQISGDSIDEVNPVSSNYYTNKCFLRLYEDISNFLKFCWIRPEDLKHYTSVGIQYFKMQGRQSVMRGDPVRAVAHYFSEEFDGDLADLLLLFAPFPYLPRFDNKKLDGFIEPFRKNPSFCSRDCTTCRYCPDFVRKCTDYDRDKARAEMEYGELLTKSRGPLLEL